MTSPITLAQVSLADASTAIGVDAANNVSSYTSTDGTNWTQMSITGKPMKQVSIGADYTICGLDPSGMIWQGNLKNSPFTWTQMPGGPLTQISCGFAHNIWGVDSNNAIWQFTGSWVRITGVLKQVTVASDGTVWGVGTDSMIYRYMGNNNWTQMPGGPIAQLSCGAATEIWGVDSSNVVWRYTSSWAKVPGQLKQVKVSSNGKACWGIGMDNSVSRYVYQNQTWTPLTYQGALPATSTTFTTSFESGNPQPTWSDSVDSNPKPAGNLANVGGIAGNAGPQASVRNETTHSGSTALMYSGSAQSGGAFAYMKIFDLSAQPLTFSSTAALSYWIYPQSTATSPWATGGSTAVAIDLIFSDGSNLRDSGSVDQHGNGIHPHSQAGHLTLDTWNQVTVNLGTYCSGKQLLRIDLGYDDPSATGGYRGYLDDLSLTTS